MMMSRRYPVLLRTLVAEDFLLNGIRIFWSAQDTTLSNQFHGSLERGFFRSQLSKRLGLAVD